MSAASSLTLHDFTRFTQGPNHRKILSCGRFGSWHHLHGLSYPFFVAVIDKSKAAISIYSTLLRTVLYWSAPESDFVIRMGGDYLLTVLSDAPGPQILTCGEPIASVAIADLDAKETRDAARRLLRQIMQYWIRLEYDALAWKANYIPMVPLVAYQTNKVPTSVPNLLTVAKSEHTSAMMESLNNSLFAVYMCADTLSRNQGYDFSASERRALKKLSDESLSFAHRLGKIAEKLPARRQLPVRTVYRSD